MPVVVVVCGVLPHYPLYTRVKGIIPITIIITGTSSRRSC